MAYTLGSPILNYHSVARSWNFSLLVTEECNLRCTYCYEWHKNRHHKMSREVGFRVIDFLFELPQSGEAIELDFSGGEMGLAIELVTELVFYFKKKLWEYPTHPWQATYMLTFSTNGTLYHTEKFQRLLWENRYHGRPLVTIDGTKRKHDSARRFADGSGSYDIVAKNVKLMLQQFPDSGSKVTFGSRDLPYVSESVIHLWELGFQNIHANVVYEDVWKQGDPELFESELCKLADIAIDRGFWKTKNTSLFFDPRQHDWPVEDRNFCGTGGMMSVDSEGNLHNCVRFHPFTMKNYSGRSIGNIWDGVNEDALRPFHCLRKSLQSPQKCLECEWQRNCGWCKGHDYDISGTLFHRATFICEMHKARCRANQYYWRELEKRTGTKPQDLEFMLCVGCPM